MWTFPVFLELSSKDQLSSLQELLDKEIGLEIVAASWFRLAKKGFIDHQLISDIKISSEFALLSKVKRSACASFGELAVRQDFVREIFFYFDFIILILGKT